MTESAKGKSVRRRAEERVHALPKESGSGTPGEMSRLIHELQVHQLELEMQNEELRRVQAELEASRDRYAHLYDFAPVGYFTLSGESLVVEANLTAATSLGAERGKMLHQPLHRLIAPEDQDHWYRCHRLLQDTAEPQTCEVRMVHANGSLVPVRLHATVAPGDTARIRVVVSDLSERKRAEAERLEMQQRLHAQRLESLGILAGGLAHDFNNLLTVILGRLDLALMALPRNSKVRNDVMAAVDASQSAANLTRQMLAYTGKGHFAMRRVNLNQVIEEGGPMLRACASKANTLSRRLAPTLPAVMADPGQVQQVLMNLVANAAEAIGDKPGVITIATNVTESDAAVLSQSRLEEKPAPGRFVCLEVTDTGRGMDEHTRRLLFDPFFSTKSVGRGLGMSAVLGIVRSHKAAIFVDSEEGQGATVRVLFPVAQKQDPRGSAPEDAAAAGPSVAERWRASGTILVVDDEPEVLKLCQQLVRRLGFEVLTAKDGLDALDRFREHHDEIVCVLLDLTMPGMNGATTFRELRRMRPGVKVILSSGYGEEEAARRFREDAPAAFLYKPYRLPALRAALRRVLVPG